MKENQKNKQIHNCGHCQCGSNEAKQCDCQTQKDNTNSKNMDNQNKNSR